MRGSNPQPHPHPRPSVRPPAHLETIALKTWGKLGDNLAEGMSSSFAYSGSHRGKCVTSKHSECHLANKFIEMLDIRLESRLK